jgi:hypothetical protein
VLNEGEFLKAQLGGIEGTEGSLAIPEQRLEIALVPGLPNIDNQVDCATKKEALGVSTWHLERVRDGFPLESANCVGGGKTDAGGFRFMQFRCKVVVKDRSPYEAMYAPRVRLVGGRIVANVTGPRSFRWAVIP